MLEPIDLRVWCYGGGGGVRGEVEIKKMFMIM